LSLPAIEFLAPRDKSPGLAASRERRHGGDRRQAPGHFPAFVASLPMNNVPEALHELDRADRRARRQGHPDLHET